MTARNYLWGLLALALGAAALPLVAAGPYSLAFADPTNTRDAPIPGFVGPEGEGLARLPNGSGGFTNPRNYVNPLFLGWATSASGYYRSDTGITYSNPALALGPVTGNFVDVVALGDLATGQTTPGTVTLGYTHPIADMEGADFVVFENGFYSQYTTGGGSNEGEVWAELAYVEVSSDGVTFARMPARSLTPGTVGSYGTLDPRDLYNLAGKHVNGQGLCWGTPFFLEDLAADPLVLGGQVDLSAIRYIRIVDVPGRGDFLDATGAPIYDSWLTFGSGGFDLEAVGAISVPLTFAQWQDVRGLTGAQRGKSADPDRDGLPNLLEFALGGHPLRVEPELRPVLGWSAELGRPILDFRLDRRARGVQVELEAATDLGAGSVGWEVLARSVDGAPLEAVVTAPVVPEIVETSASHIHSVRALSRCAVTDIAGPTGEPTRYLRLRVTLEEEL